MIVHEARKKIARELDKATRKLNYDDEDFFDKFHCCFSSLLQLKKQEIFI